MVFRLLLWAGLSKPDSHSVFSVLHKQNAQIAIRPWLCTGTRRLSCPSLADPYAALPNSRAERTIISCTHNNIPWSAPQFIPARYFSKLILLDAFALASSVWVFQVRRLSNVSPSILWVFFISRRCPFNLISGSRLLLTKIWLKIWLRTTGKINFMNYKGFSSTPVASDLMDITASEISLTVANENSPASFSKGLVKLYIYFVPHHYS
jgi:hypothetical protein